MTKDKARKAAARARAAATGERYVVARRAIDSSHASGGAGLLHRLTHLVPGVPAHVEGGLDTRPNPRRRKPGRDDRHGTAEPLPMRRHQGRMNDGTPRVLVGWQNRIARLVGAK
jgi:hypothetical protein